MTTHVKVGEAKTRLSELLAKAEAGEEIIISRGDEQIARLVAISKKSLVNEAIAGILELRTKAKPVTQAEIRSWRDEGRL